MDHVMNVKNSKLSIAYIAAHFVSVVVCVVAIVGLGKFIPAGAEGGWLTRIYAGVLFAAAAVINLVFLILAIYKKGYSATAVAFRIIIIAAPILFLLWY